MSQYQRVKLLFYVRKIDHAGVLMNEKNRKMVCMPEHGDSDKNANRAVE